MKRKITAGLFILFAALTLSCAGGFGKANVPEPTAIVVDAETGEPIEGAVALAVWWSMGSGGAFEGGGIPYAERRATAVSDKEGRIYINDFWKRDFFILGYPDMAVYKCGYVCWYQHHYLLENRERYDFKEKNRIVRMEKWPENFSFERHESLISFFVARHLLGHTGPFYKAYDECELQKRIDERSETREKELLKKSE